MAVRSRRSKGSPARRRPASAPGGVHPPRRLSVRRLHARPDHVRGGPCSRRAARAPTRRSSEFMSGNLCRCGAYQNIRRRDPRGRARAATCRCGPSQYARALDAAEAVALVGRRPGCGVPGRRHDAARPDAQGRHRRASPPRRHHPAPATAASSAASACARASARSRRWRSWPRTPTVAARLPLVREALLLSASVATAQHGHDRRQPAAADALPLLPRPPSRRLQQARARIGLRGGRRRGPDARDPRRERALHRPACLRPGVALVALDAVGAHPGPVRRASRAADRLLPARRASGRTSRTSSTTASSSPPSTYRCRRPAPAPGYLKVRDRASYEFALVSVAAALVVDDGVVADARLALGGVGTIPWRARGPRPSCAARPGAGRFARRGEGRAPRPVHGAGHRVQGRRSPSARSSGSLEDLSA